jgi:hypothetical protein
MMKYQVDELRSQLYATKTETHDSELVGIGGKLSDAAGGVAALLPAAIID